MCGQFAVVYCFVRTTEEEGRNCVLLNGVSCTDILLSSTYFIQALKFSMSLWLMLSVFLQRQNLYLRVKGKADFVLQLMQSVSLECLKCFRRCSRKSPSKCKNFGIVWSIAWEDDNEVYLSDGIYTCGAKRTNWTFSIGKKSREMWEKNVKKCKTGREQGEEFRKVLF